MPWVIAHQPPKGAAPLYWIGSRFDADSRAGEQPQAMDHDVAKALRFATAEDAQQAYRGAYRPVGSCCAPLQVAESATRPQALRDWIRAMGAEQAARRAQAEWGHTQEEAEWLIGMMETHDRGGS